MGGRIVWCFEAQVTWPPWQHPVHLASVQCRFKCNTYSSVTPVVSMVDVHHSMSCINLDPKVPFLQGTERYSLKTLDSCPGPGIKPKSSYLPREGKPASPAASACRSAYL
uniref:Uncharacterized protein n=1 Tax=Mustela putorius furo TaxID=9669 RepID=M3YN88_MUSPF